MTDKQCRTIFFMKIFNGQNVHQTTPATFINRYPVIFNACKDYFKDKNDIKILSFGCSTGEEVITLRYYFPNAIIVGAEINKHSLEICKQRHLDDKITFIYSTPEEIKKYGPFDAVFCMAVLQRTPHSITEKGITSLKKNYPFEKFEKQIIELDKYVKKNGLMIVHFSQYDLRDTEISSKYDVYGNYNQDEYGLAIFDHNSNLITEYKTRYSIFKKIKE